MLLAGCSPSLDAPDQLLIACSADAECPNGWHCTSAGACAHGDDNAALTVFSVTSTSSTTLVITFSEPLRDDVATASGRYAIDHDVAVQSAAIDPSHTTVTLTTSAQQARHYQLSIASDVIDVYGVVLDSGSTQQPFVGTGDPVDESAPGLLSPEDKASVSSTDVTLSWTPLRGAVSCVVDVATSADFSTPIAGSPWMVQAPSTQQPITLPGAGSYYWRVTGDTTLDSNTNLGRFAFLESSIAVYCAASDNCEFGALDATAWENGNVTTPFKSITRAINVGVLRGVTTIHVAGRGGAAYSDTVELSGIFNVDGAWDPAFTHRDYVANVTTIASNGVVKLVGARDAQSTFDGFQITGAEGTQVGIVIADCTSDLTVSNLATSDVQVVATNMTGPILTSITANTVALDGGATQLRDSTVMVGLTASDATTVTNVVGGATVIISGTATLKGGSFGAIDVTSGQPIIDGVSVTGNGLYAITTDTSGLADISNSVLGTPTSPITIRIGSNELGIVTSFTNNTVFGSLVLDTESLVTVTNNLFVCTDSATIAAGITAMGTPALSYEHNVVVGCAALFYTTDAEEQQTLYTTDADLTAASTAAQRYANNTPLASSLADVVDAQGVTLASAPAETRQGGKSTTGATCGPASNEPCGDVTKDKNGAARTVPVSVGAYEVDP